MAIKASFEQEDVQLVVLGGQIWELSQKIKLYFLMWYEAQQSHIISNPDDEGVFSDVYSIIV